MTETKINKNILFIRMDRIGDLVLSLPVDQHPSLVNCQVDWVVNKATEFVMEVADPRRDYIIWPNSPNLSEMRALAKNLTKKSYDAAVFFQGPKWVAFVLWLAGIPIRSGQKSRVESFLFLNKALRQNRSKAMTNELDYNWELVEYALSLTKTNPQSLSVASRLPGISVPLPKEYIVVHPGMGGSALNWGEHNYIQFLEKMVTEKYDIIITGTPSDEEFIRPIRNKFSDSDKVQFLDGKLSLHELVYVLERARAVVAPSTGVVHLAASTGTKTIGIYPPIQVQNKTRWGAKGEQVQCFSPNVECPEQFKCRGASCPHYDCMNKILPDNLVKEIL
ncbi:MAG: glycosyltransferase family 9 protein [Bdellovibrionales bacterium]